MKTISRTSRFEKDVKKMRKRGKSFSVFKHIITQLYNNEILEPRFKDHKLVGNYVGTRECHIEPEWLLIYINSTQELVLIRTGTHADLFG